MVVPPAVADAELDGLKASAVAVALTVFDPLLQIRAKNVGKSLRSTVTRIWGLMPNTAFVPLQVAVSGALGNVTTMLVGAAPPIVFC